MPFSRSIVGLLSSFTSVLYFSSDVSATQLCHYTLSGASLELSQRASVVYMTNAMKPTQGFSVYFGRGSQLPATLRQIGSSRAETFSLVNEGPGAGLPPQLARLLNDVDQYDPHYAHLVAVSNADEMLAGSYRVGDVGYLRRRPGGYEKNVYTASLFKGYDLFMNTKIDNQGTTFADVTLDLGRAFVRPEHQRSPLSFFSLLNGIGSILHSNPLSRNPKQFKALSGAASLSDKFSDRSKAILNAYLLRYHSTGVNVEMSGKNPAQFSKITEAEDLALLDSAPKIEAVVKYIEEIEKNLGQNNKVNPLFAIYISFGARFMAAHHDVEFHTIDWFIFADASKLTVDQLTPYMGRGEIGAAKAAEFLNYHMEKDVKAFSPAKASP